MSSQTASSSPFLNAADSIFGSSYPSSIGTPPSTPGTEYSELDRSFISEDIVEACPMKSGPQHSTLRPPRAKEEFRRIRQACPTLASNGCTKQFCQAGRMIHTDEERVGRDRPLAEIQREAAAFLQECRDHGIIETDEILETRQRKVASEISIGAVKTMVVTEDGHTEPGIAGANWALEQDELLYGIRAAWRNAKRCIMRSQHMELELCDLRHEHSSRGMADAIIKGMRCAFNNGIIKPTVLVFPPRKIGKRGPMIWNGQILAFAGYRQDDGTILGDPANADLTDAIIELGWRSPERILRTQWDILPIVTMADDDEPVITELPEDLKKVVQINHPRYKQQFEDLGLKWVAFPALSRLGFDIGGVQITASPFIGWFMDAEIGVRNLADSSRYNVLPKIAKALEAPENPDWDIEDLPEYEKLVVLSRAQAELNYAVNYSFIRSKISMSDSLTASAKWEQYDEDHFREKGFRLPSDPYYISPPLGSIIPIWHRGGAPNYQPKPLICRHVQDPIKAWRRERPKSWKSPNHAQQGQETFGGILKEKLTELRRLSLRAPQQTVRIHYCSSGITAAKLATKLYSRVIALKSENLQVGNVLQPQPLNNLDISSLKGDDVLLLVVSSTGSGEMPRNGANFLQACKANSVSEKRVFFAVFGNGDSTYSTTFNSAAIETNNALSKSGFQPIVGGIYGGDSSVENPPWNAFNAWWEGVRNSLLQEDKTVCSKIPQMEEPVESSIRHFPTATLEDAITKKTGITKITLNLREGDYHEMDHVRIFPPNRTGDVARALEALRICPQEPVTVGKITVPLSKYLTEYADLNSPFTDFSWVANFFHFTSSSNSLKAKTALDVLEVLRNKNIDYKSILPTLCASLAIIGPKVFSVASSLSQNVAQIQSQAQQPQEALKGNKLDLLVKIHPSGRFSDAFLSQAQADATMRYSISPFAARDILFPADSDLDFPIIAVATGSGIGPVRSLLHHRAAVASSRRTGTASCNSTISVFAGYKEEDSEVVSEALESAQDVLDRVELVPSNGGKIRVQDRLLTKDAGAREALHAKLRHPRCVVFVCAGEMASEGVGRALDILVREIQNDSDGVTAHLDTTTVRNAKEWLGDRYVEEIFRC